MPGGVNLIPMERVMVHVRRARVRRWVFVCTAYAGVLTVAWSTTQVVQGGGRSALAAELAHLDQRIADDAAATKQLQPKLAAAIATIEAGRSVGNQPDWSLLLTLLGQFLGDNSVLRSCELVNTQAPAAPKSDKDEKPSAPQGRSYRLNLAGVARSHAAVLGFVRELEECGLFQNVTLIETRPEAFGTGTAVGFRVECGLADEAGGTR